MTRLSVASPIPSTYSNSVGTLFNKRSRLCKSPSVYWLIRQGAVRTHAYLEDGSVITMGIWTQGDVVSKLLTCHSNYYIEALSQVEAIPIQPTVWQPPVDVIISYWQETEILVLARAQQRIETRLLSVFQWLARRFGKPLERGCLIDLQLSHQDLAELVGTTRVTITKALKQLEHQGMIDRTARKLVLLQEPRYWFYQI